MITQMLIIAALLIGGTIMVIFGKGKSAMIAGIVCVFVAIYFSLYASNENSKEYNARRYTLVLYSTDGMPPVVYLHTKAVGASYQLDDGRYYQPTGVYSVKLEK